MRKQFICEIIVLKQENSKLRTKLQGHLALLTKSKNHPLNE